MTLRVTVEIVPRGDEDSKRKLSVLDISNAGLVRNEGFGHEVCKYDVVEATYNQVQFPGTLDVTVPKTEDIKELCGVPEHDRREGYWPLVLKAISLNLERMGR